MRFISNHDAAARCGQTIVAFRCWLRRMEERHPEYQVLRVRGRIEEGSLEGLLKLAVQDHFRESTENEELAER